MSVDRADLEPVLVSILWQDDMPAIPAYILPGHTWNGWACPYFELDTLRAFRTQLDAIFPNDPTIPESVFITWDLNEEPSLMDGENQEELAGSVTMSDGTEMWYLGSYGLTWEVVENGYEANICGGCGLAIDPPTGATTAHWDHPFGTQVVAWSCSRECAGLVEAKRVLGRLSI